MICLHGLLKIIAYKNPDFWLVTAGQRSVSSGPAPTWSCGLGVSAGVRQWARGQALGHLARPNGRLPCHWLTFLPSPSGSAFTTFPYSAIHQKQKPLCPVTLQHAKGRRERDEAGAAPGQRRASLELELTCGLQVRLLPNALELQLW